ncbi:CBS domain-containing protein [Nocardiopsis mwathae]|uniref:CBS domain-containing protein n=1 Tax=Nocardiopsis mwathae TaxID=1472723 RepID=A0A7W9YJ97_9ACTN|nr:CBS domain-containing protein [Nocardiopsis mwathae]MBB6173158.1 CBS domain-containing protein [Nocardiopsis mwathae]
MTTAADIMHSDVQCIDEDQTLDVAAQMMRNLGVGSLPICGNDRKLKGIITDRDIVIRCVAEGRDCRSTTAAELAQGKPFWVDEDADIDVVLQGMIEHRIKRVPVIRDFRLTGIISEADLARHLPEQRLGKLIEAMKSGPADQVPGAGDRPHLTAH